MMKKLFLVIPALLLVLSPLPALAALGTVTPGIVATNNAGTTTTANFTYSGAPDEELTFNAWLKDTTASTWITQSLLLATVNASNQTVTSDFAVEFNYADLGLQTGKTYLYYVSVTTASGYQQLMTNPACFKPAVGVAPCGSGGTASGNAGAGKFTYMGAPTVTCDANVQICDFKTTIKVTVSGALEFALRGFPKNAFDAGTTATANLTSAPQSVAANAGSQYQVSVPVNYPGIKAFAEAANDPKFYFQFFESKNSMPSQMSLFDTAVQNIPVSIQQGATAGTVTLPGSQTLPLPNIIMKLPKLVETTITLEGTIDTPATPKNVNYIMRFGTDANNLVNLTGSLFSGNLTSAKPFVKNISGQADGTYYFEIIESVSGYSYGVKSFDVTGAVSAASTATAGSGSAVGNASFNFNASNSSTPVNGVCGTAAGTTAATPSLLTGTLCAAGTQSSVTDGGTSWVWTCTGLANGTTADCSASKDTDTVKKGWLQNPLAAGLDTFPEIFKAVYNGIVLPVAIPFIAIAIMYSGFLFVTARRSGNTTGIEKAKDVFKYTIIGAVLLLGGMVIANALQGTLCELMGNCPAITP